MNGSLFSFSTRALGLVMLLPSVELTAQIPTWQDPPKLVVGIVVDQMRVDYIYRYWHNFGEGGFKRLINEGSFQRDAHYDYAPTETAPGHASIYTGTTPSNHGITFNDMFFGPEMVHHYCVADLQMTGLGTKEPIGQRSPKNLLATTIADELERVTDGRSKTIGIALKDRSAILPIGRTGDAAYWFDAGADGAFVSSTWYGTSLPKWLVEMNSKKLASGYLDRTWTKLLPDERYGMVLPDDNPYEEVLQGEEHPTLPKDLKAMFKASGTTELIKFTPWGNTLTVDLALAAIDGEELGKDAITDLLTISFSSPDEIAHEVGPRALEVEDMYLRLDQELARLLSALDERVGNNAYSVFLTADHGVVDVPQYLKDLKASAGYIERSTLKQELNKALVENFGEGNWVKRIHRAQVFLNDSLIQAKGIDPEKIQRIVVDRAMQHPAIADAVTAVDLMRSEYSSGGRRLLQRGFMYQRSGDVLMIYRPGFLEAYGSGPPKGTTHMTPWNYDTHVPVIFFGKGIKHGEVLRRTSITDIAPTVTAIIGMALPNASTGRVVEESLR